MESKEETTSVPTTTKVVKTTGKQLNNLYLYSVYFVSFTILVIFLMLAFFGFKDTMSFVDIWPFIFYVVTVIAFSLLVIEKSKTKSKRTVQRDMREL